MGCGVAEIQAERQGGWGWAYVTDDRFISINNEHLEARMNKSVISLSPCTLTVLRHAHKHTHRDIHTVLACVFPQTIMLIVHEALSY